jgi:hypothetical protein
LTSRSEKLSVRGVVSVVPPVGGGAVGVGGSVLCAKAGEAKARVNATATNVLRVTMEFCIAPLLRGGAPWRRNPTLALPTQGLRKGDAKIS